MSEHSQDKKEQFISFLKAWIDDVIKNKSWDKFIDLHIDEIDSAFKEKHTWVEGSLFLFNNIITLIDQSAYDIFLVIPLSCVSEPNDLNISDLRILESELDFAPPSFYLFEKNNKNFEGTIQSATYLNRMSEASKLKVYYKEEKQHDELYRTLYFRSS